MPSPFFFVVENGRKSEFFTNAGVIPHPLSAIDKVTHPFLCLVSTIILSAANSISGIQKYISYHTSQFLSLATNFVKSIKFRYHLCVPGALQALEGFSYK